MTAHGFLGAPEPTPEAHRLFEEDLAGVGYVMNLSRLWAHRPGLLDGLAGLLREAASVPGLTVRQRGVLVAACASSLGDSYCSLAWGSRLAKATDPQTASGVLRGDDGGLTPAERALAAWARAVTRDPNATGEADVQALRDAGYSDGQILAITVFVALRLAFSTVNDALGARPDAALRATAPAAVLEAVTYGRPIAEPAA